MKFQYAYNYCNLIRRHKQTSLFSSGFKGPILEGPSRFSICVFRVLAMVVEAVGLSLSVACNPHISLTVFPKRCSTPDFSTSTPLPAPLLTPWHINPPNSLDQKSLPKLKPTILKFSLIVVSSFLAHALTHALTHPSLLLFRRPATGAVDTIRLRA
jgi:hypothetical protein